MSSVRDAGSPRVNILAIFAAGFLCAGCSQIGNTGKAAFHGTVEAGKTFWGSSTRALEEARSDALKGSFNCSYEECFDVVLSFGRAGDVPKPVTAFADGDSEEEEETDSAGTEKEEIPSEAETAGPQFFNVFLKDRRQGHIVVMGIAGNVNTTEVGIFFEKEEPGLTRIEISSLSTSAKTKAAAWVFEELEKRFGRDGQPPPDSSVQEDRWEAQELLQNPADTAGDAGTAEESLGPDD